MRTNLSQFPAEWKLPRVLRATDVERWVAAIPPSCTSVSVTLGSWKQTGPFADARLQGALCILHRNGIRTNVNVPPLTFIEQRAGNAFSDPTQLEDTSPITPTERTLAGTVAGLVIGQLCKFDSSHKDIPALQRKRLKEKRYIFGVGHESALAIPTEPFPMAVPRKSILDREATFYNRLLELLGLLGMTDKFRTKETAWFNNLRSFAFEAAENTTDHGRLDFEMNPIRSVRFVRMRRIDIGRSGYDANKIAPGFEESFEEYIQCLNFAEDIRHLWASYGGRLLEITIADGGVGISARMAGGFGIYQGALQAEMQCLMDALVPNGTTKSPSESGRGQGFKKMLRACSHLSGLVIVRTGRLKLSRTYRQLDGTRESVDFGDKDSRTYRPRFSEQKLPLVAGTSISLIFPIDPRDQFRERC